MSNQPNYIEMIDAYLTGSLSPEDSARLMESLEQDPALKEEFLLQKDLVHSLQNHRRNELKARLDKIEVGTGYSVPSAVSLKIIAGVAILALLGTGAYFAYDQSRNTEEAAPLEVSDKNTINLPLEEGPQKTEATEEAPALAEEAPSEINSGASINNEEVRVETPSPVAVQPKPDVEEKDIPETPAADRPSPASAEVVKPDVITSFEDQDPAGAVPEVETPEDNLKNARKFDTQNIEVSTKTDKRYPFHYMFYENQLSIYGDFSKVPYEVLEVNSGAHTSYFLYHSGKYYELNPNQRKISRLKELTNNRIIQELEVTRNQKLKQ